MAKIARKAARRAVAGLVTGDAVSLLAARSKEKQTDDFQYEITSYLSKLARRPLSRELSDRILVLLHSANDLERIGDLAINIVELAERKLSQRILFSTQAMGEAVLVEETLMSMFALVLKAMKDNDKQAAEQALGLEAQLNDMQVELRKNHVRRMAENECTPESGLIFIDLVDNVEKMGDHLTNIAQSVMGGLQWSHR
jgi:phosphate:Na+ symporter